MYWCSDFCVVATGQTGAPTSGPTTLEPTLNPTATPTRGLVNLALELQSHDVVVSSECGDLTKNTLSMV
eukprot:UN11711